jgi:hypothetical protein
MYKYIEYLIRMKYVLSIWFKWIIQQMWYKTATCAPLCLSFCLCALKYDRFPSSGITDSILRLYLPLYPRKPVLLLPDLNALWQNEGQH